MYKNSDEVAREVEKLRATTVAAATNWKPTDEDPDGRINAMLSDLRHGKTIAVQDYADLAELMKYEPDNIRADFDFTNLLFSVKLL